MGAVLAQKKSLEEKLHDVLTDGKLLITQKITKARELVRAGANPYITINGEDAFSTLAKQGFGLLRNYNQIKDGYSPANALYETVVEARMIAFAKAGNAAGTVEMLRETIRIDADINPLDNERISPCMAFAMQGNVEAVAKIFAIVKSQYGDEVLKNLLDKNLQLISDEDFVEKGVWAAQALMGAMEQVTKDKNGRIAGGDRSILKGVPKK